MKLEVESQNIVTHERRVEWRRLSERKRIKDLISGRFFGTFPETYVQEFLPIFRGELLVLGRAN